MNSALGGLGGKLSFVGVTSTRRELLRSPVSDLPCVHWRLRIVEQVDPSLRLVHEIASTEEFDLTWPGTTEPAHNSDRADQADGANPTRTSDRPRALAKVGWQGAVRLRVVPDTARIAAHAVLHRPGSPGALAVGRQFGFSGSLSVEEFTLAAGEEVVADGVIEADASVAVGPFRGVERDTELLAATLRLPARAILAPALLPWALGTAAALLGGVAAAGWVAWRLDLAQHAHAAGIILPAEVGPHRHSRRHFSQPE
jgi:hypothetical protein